MRWERERILDEKILRERGVCELRQMNGIAVVQRQGGQAETQKPKPKGAGHWHAG